MKFFLFFYVLLTNTVISSPLELNAENLTLLALKHSSEEAVKDYARYLARSKHSKTYFKYIKNKQKIKELVSQVEKDLVSDIKSLPENTKFKISKTIKFTTFNTELKSFNITNFSTDVDTLFRSYKKNKGLPDYFFLLYANLELFNNIKINAKEASRFSEISQLQTGYVEVTLELPEFQNNQEFQVVIKDIAVFSDSSKKQLLSNKKETKTSQTIIESWLLSKGFTNKLIGIHAFSVFGYRLQDMIGRIDQLKNNCKKTKPLGIHLVVKCKYDFSKNILLKTEYIGGKFSKLDLIAIKQPLAHEIDRVVKKLALSLKQPRDFFNGINKKWTKYSVNFEYFPDAFTKKAVLGSIFTFDKKPSEHALIFTMMSQATKKLIEDNK